MLTYTGVVDGVRVIKTLGIARKVSQIGNDPQKTISVLVLILHEPITH